LPSSNVINHQWQSVWLWLTLP